ncbi:MAG: OmpA family protein [Clostridia bacterium]|nr:OmpA family protein [Clostridia bacterium]
MKQMLMRSVALLLACFMLVTLCACKKGGKSGGGSSTNVAVNQSVWYMGGSDIGAGDVDVPGLFADVKDTVDPAQLYAKHKLTEEMLHGCYTLNNMEKDLETVRKDIPLEDVTLKDQTVNMTALPVSVFFGADNISNEYTDYDYSEYEGITDSEVAVLRFATKDEVGSLVCTYEIKDNTLVFHAIHKTSGENEPIQYELLGTDFVYEFQLAGPCLTFSKGGHSLQLKAHCVTENTDDDLWMSGYSLTNSPLIANTDFFSASGLFTYAVMRDGHYYDLSAYKFDDQGRVTVYFAEKETVYKEGEGWSVEPEEKINAFTQQYAYIMQSTGNTFFPQFSIILMDDSKVYYYTDTNTDREIRILEGDGTKTDNLTDDQIKEIAEKKSDLYDDLSQEFEAKGIDVAVNRSSGEIIMDASVLFGGDSAEITADGKALLNKFLDAYTSVIYQEKYNGFIAKTMVEGHTAPLKDSTYESGLPLSKERAENVKAYCLSPDTGVDTSKLAPTLEAVGLSNSKPIYDSNGEVDLAACRRVSFRFIVNVQ